MNYATTWVRTDMGRGGFGELVTPEPLPDRGACIVCGKKDLTRGSWCCPCGGFVCCAHDRNLHTSGCDEKTIAHHSRELHAGTDWPRSSAARAMGVTS